MKPTRTDKIAGQSRFWTDYGKYALIYCAHIGLGIVAAMLVSYGLLQAGLEAQTIAVCVLSLIPMVGAAIGLFWFGYDLGARKHDR
jgi:hypothetical protein